jgi:NTF2 fold immunity protein of polymorphic toxin system component
MNIGIVALILISNFLLHAWGPEHTLFNSATQNPSQANANQPVVSAQDTPAATPQLSQSNTDRLSYKPKNGYVPDEQTAIGIAVAVWNPIYGKAQIENEKPFKATLKNGVWTVTGSLPEGFVGGTALAEISQDSGCILRVIHYK